MNYKQAHTMLLMQGAMNSKVNPGWMTAGYAWMRANVVEGAEAIEHHGWKWWKKQTPDMPQLRIELVDIWHFTLSHLLVQIGNYADAATFMVENLDAEYQRSGIVFDGRFYKFAEMNMLGKLELLIGLSVSRRVSLPLFESLLTDSGIGWDDLYRLYVGKNVLNFFRQDHGYKDGSYIKIWNGEEDNVVLDQILGQLDPGADDFGKQLYQALARRYAVVLDEAGKAA